ncbi:MAG: hypothetical protein PHN30_01960 [Bacteroidales bacterium]|nr:hypothetical protein [Bacteroidales bacterium]MDD4812568.1 hypothetical protein [Bacteroidales bacterium]
MIKKQILAAIILIITSLMGVKGQEMVLQQDVDSVPGAGNYGPNKLHFGHLYLEMGFAIPYPQTEQKLIKIPLTGSFAAGYRYKLKIFNPLAFILEAGLRWDNVRFNQFEGKQFPDTDIHSRQILHLSKATTGLGLRFRFGQRGNYLGRYLDIGVRETLLMGSRLVQTDPGNNDTGNWYRKTKQIFRGLEYMQDWVPELFARLGFNRFAITATYRMGPLFLDTVPVELPKISLGVETALVRY